MKITNIDWHPANNDEGIEWEKIVKEGSNIVKRTIYFLDQLKARERYLNYNKRDWNYNNCATKNNPCELPYFTKILADIPLFLLNHGSMPEPERIQDLEIRQANNNPNVPTELLGCYTRAVLGLGRERSAIYLAPEVIMGVGGRGAILPEVLFAKVVIHELAHAYLDDHENNDYGVSDDFYLWMEESLANYLTLVAMEIYSNRDGRPECFSQTRDFIQSQPPNYRFALEIYKHGFDNFFGMWRADKHNIRAKTRQKDMWLTYIRNNFMTTDKLTLEGHYRNLF